MKAAVNILTKRRKQNWHRVNEGSCKWPNLDGDLLGVMNALLAIGTSL